MISLITPIDEKRIRELKVGDEILLNGRIITARDAAHKFMVEKRPEFIREYLKDGVIYHCGPIMKFDGKKWSTVAAGPTTSIREEPYEADVIKEYGLRGIIGKGGMGEKTVKACSEFGCVYFHAIGGLASILADKVESVECVFMLREFGVPEAFWVFDVKDFPVVVTMDASCNSLHKNVLHESSEIAKTLLC